MKPGRERSIFIIITQQIPALSHLQQFSTLRGIVGTSRKLYPTMLYLITNIANRHKEFRTTTDKDGSAAYFDKVLPCYTVFHKDTETFSNVWTEYTDDIDEFCVRYDKDMAEYGNKKQFDANPLRRKTLYPYP